MASKQELPQQKRELEKMEEGTIPARVFLPAADIYETSDALSVILEMPGVDKANVNISVEDDVLNVEGQLDFSKYQKLAPVYTEYNIGHYARSFRLFSKIDQSKISAEMNDGVLYFNRYTDDAIDLCDVLSSFAPQAKATLHELCKVMGMSGKPDSIDGSEVGQYFLEGKIKEIADYCETDIVNTYRVWLRHELFRGKLTPIQFQFSEQKLGEFIMARGNTKPHLDGMVEVRASSEISKARGRS